MSWPLVVLCAAGFFIVAVLVSIILGESLFALRRFAAFLSPRHRVGFWLMVAALPTLIATVIVGLSLIPASGPAGDHCLGHGSHHPHLCLDHANEQPGMALIVMAVLLALRVLYVKGAFLRLVLIDRKTTRALSQGCRQERGVYVFPGEKPQGFTLGFFHPQVHLSEGLASMPPEIQEPVRAHERAHARFRDPLWRALYPLLSFAHLPSAARPLRDEFVDAQELAADREAALEGGDPVLVADAILVLARSAAASTLVPSFGHGNIARRVEALLSPPPAPTKYPLVALALSLALLVTGLGTFHENIHHMLETVLGALG